jgi:hypothetical protein
MTRERKQSVMNLVKYFEKASKGVKSHEQFSEYRKLLRVMCKGGLISKGERNYIVGRMLKVSKVMNCIGNFYLINRKYK